MEIIKSAPPYAEVGRLGVLELQTWSGPTNALQNVTMLDLNEIRSLPADILTPTSQDMLWLTGKWLQSVQPTPEMPTRVEGVYAIN